MRQDRYTIVLLLILLFQISGYTTEDILLKTWGRYPFVMIANHDKIYLSYSTQSSDITHWAVINMIYITMFLRIQLK
jgi:hypothetical protein